ncbi:MAG: DUF2877 domain-containing protein [Actinobacteria bacterium]|nr:DUF2877 domain-containing protein [Actinomycetota bacterium]
MRESAAAHAAAVSHAADAPSGLRPVLTGPPRPGRVLAAFPHAVYVTVGAGADAAVVAVVSADGIQLPNALVVRTPAAGGPFGAVRAGAPAVVGDGRIVVGLVLAVTVGRWSDRRVLLPTTDRATLLAGAHRLRAAMDRACVRDPATEARAAEVARWVAVGDRGRAATAAGTLLGWGEGLTPTGDDVLAGVLAAGRAFASAVGDPRTVATLAALSADVDRLAPRRTNALSASLLRHAGRGEMARPAASVTRAVAAGREHPAAVADLLRVGHRSGADLALGIVTAAGLVASSAIRPPSAHGGIR